MHRVYRKRLTRGYLRYLQNHHRGEGMVTITIFHVPYYVTCWIEKDRNIRILHGVDSWTLLRLCKKKNMKVLDYTPNGNHRKDLTERADYLEQVEKSAWWNWDDGSRLFFWCCPRCYQRAVRDGTRMFIHRKHLPNAWKRQTWHKNPIS